MVAFFFTIVANLILERSKCETGRVPHFRMQHRHQRESLHRDKRLVPQEVEEEEQELHARHGRTRLHERVVP